MGQLRGLRMIIVLFFCLSCCGAQAAGAQAHGALFKVEGGGHTLYLFGTMHVGLPEFYPFEPRLAAALEHAPALALELDPTGDPVAIAQAMHEYGEFAPGSAGYAATPPALKEKLARVLKQRHMEAGAVATFKPWLLATVLSLSEFAQQGYRTDLAADAYLAQQAHSRHIPVIELESVQSQLSLFARMPQAQQWQFLEDSVDAIESGKENEQMHAIVDAWRGADQAGLEKIAAQAESDTSMSGKFVQTVLLEERNGPLAEKLAQLLARQDGCVAAIGVLHLVGRNSVPLKLRALGMTVSRIY